MSIPVDDRSRTDIKKLKKAVLAVVCAILKIADTVSSTLTMAGGDCGEGFVLDADICTIDEAAAAGEIECYIP